MKFITVLEDDVDGSEAEETVGFQLDGVTYDIDLNTAHAEELRSVLRPYIEAGRKQRSGTAARRRPSLRVDTATPAKVRAWAQHQGIAVNERGRIRAEIVEQYEAAH